MWELRVSAGKDPLSGRYRTATRRVEASGKRAAGKLLAQFAAEVQTTGLATGVTFGELLHRYFEAFGPRMVPAGRKETKAIIEVRLKPLHPVKLSRLAGRGGAATLDAFYAALADRGGTCRARKVKCTEYPCPHGGGAPLAAATIVRTHVVVSAALEQAVKWDLIDRNPARRATPGAADPVDHHAPTVDEVRRLFELAADHNPELVVFLVLAAVTGRRRGALCALRWGDVDLAENTVTFGHVISLGPDGPERIPASRTRKKTREGRIAIDGRTAAVLASHRASCASRALVGAVRLDDAYVFSGDGGTTAWYPSSVSRTLRRLREEGGLGPGRLHDLRGFVVNTLLGAGVDLGTVQDRIGHRPGSAVTLGTYRDFLATTDRAAADLLGSLLDLPAPPDNIRHIRSGG